MNTGKDNKMSWFVDKYNSKSLDFIIRNTRENFGTIIMPTGTGKSGVVYADIVNHIDNLQDSRKLIINISCPILKLTQQFIRDLFSILQDIYGNKKSFSFFINSSDTGKNYNDRSVMMLDINTKPLSKLHQFIESDTNIAIVASCHKSLYKFVSKIKGIQQNTIDIVNYIDEAHLIDVRTGNDDDSVVYFDINKLCRYSTSVYALTATPDPDVTKAINEWNHFGKDSIKPIYKMSPIDAIHDNIIVPPLVKYILTSDEKITIDMLKTIMKDAKFGNPNIHHKILVTLQSADELKTVREALEKTEYKVFSTCSKYGYGIESDLEDDPEYNDVTGFINDVESYDGDCFILHIRQLIQGIDIKAITDCVIWSADSGNQRHYRHTIQIIGRALRTLSGERGVPSEKRLKKVGRVYFISPKDAADVQSNIAQFICRYYGFDNITFETKSYSPAAFILNNDMFERFQEVKSACSATDTVFVNEIIINIEDYIKKQIVPWSAFYKMNAINFNAEETAKKILSEYDTFGKSIEMNSAELLDDRDLINIVMDLFKKYNVI